MDLLKEYEKKRNKAFLDLEDRKNSLYKKHPRLEEIEHLLNSYSIKLAKSILLNNSEKNNFKLSIDNLKQEKLNILKSIGIDEPYFSPKFECSICDDKGFVNTIMCTCLKQALLNVEFNKANINKLEIENFDTFDMAYYSNTPDPDKFNSTISPRENIINIKEMSMNFIENFDDVNEKSILFTGSSGLGKTFLSNAIAKEILALGKTVFYQTSPVLFDTIINYRFGKNNVAKGFYENILEVDLLILDDLGSENSNSLIISEIFTLINTRLLNNKKTIISTNLLPHELIDKYDHRIASRVIGSYTICKFFGDDIRFLKKGIRL